MLEVEKYCTFKIWLLFYKRMIEIFCCSQAKHQRNSKIQSYNIKKLEEKKSFSFPTFFPSNQTFNFKLKSNHDSMKKNRICDRHIYTSAFDEHRNDPSPETSANFNCHNSAASFLTDISLRRKSRRKFVWGQMPQSTAERFL